MVLVDISTATFDLLKDLGLEKAIYIVKARDVFKQLGFDEKEVFVLNYQEGLLTIGVHNSIWHQEIESIKDVIIEKLNALSKDITFEKIAIKEINS